MLTTRKFGEDERGRSEAAGGARATPAKGWVTPGQASAARSLAGPRSGALAELERRVGEPHFLPRSEGGPDAVAVRSATQPQPLAELALLHLLVVDDDDALRRACCEIASGMGFSVHSAGSAPEARAVLQRQSIDLLLLDMKLPGEGGLGLLSEVKILHPEMAVLVMTAYATVSSAVEAMKIGASGLSDQAVRGGGADGDAGTDGATTADGSGKPAAAGEGERAAGRGRHRGQFAGDGEKLYRMMSKVAHSTHPY